ncbi:unnamed protein product, partial [Oikopleura dioica]
MAKDKTTSKGATRAPTPRPSSPTPMPSSPATMSVKYFKTVEHLSLKELALICRQYSLPYKTGDTKKDMAKQIQKLMPSFLTNLKWKYFFIQEEKTLKIIGKPRDSAVFVQKEAKSHHIMDCDAILEEITALRMLAFEDEQMSLSSDCEDEDDDENITIKHEYKLLLPVQKLTRFLNIQNLLMKGTLRQVIIHKAVSRHAKMDQHTRLTSKRLIKSLFVHFRVLRRVLLATNLCQNSHNSKTNRNRMWKLLF